MPEPHFPILIWAFKRKTFTNTSNGNMAYILSILSVRTAHKRRALNVIENIAIYKMKIWLFYPTIFWISCWISYSCQPCWVLSNTVNEFCLIELQHSMGLLLAVLYIDMSFFKFSLKGVLLAPLGSGLWSSWAGEPLDRLLSKWWSHFPPLPRKCSE